MKLFGQAKYTWIAAGLVFIAGVFNIFNPTLDKTIRVIWYMFTPIAAVTFVVGLINHYRRKRGEDHSE